MTTLFTEAASAKRFEKQLDANLLTDVLTTTAAEKNAADMRLRSLQVQSNNNLAEAFKYLGEQEVHNSSLELLQKSRKLVDAMPEKTATANSSSLFGGKVAITDVNVRTSTIGFAKD